MHQVLRETVEPIPMLALHVQADENGFGDAVPAACGRAWNLVKELGIAGGRMIAIYISAAEAIVGIEVESGIEGTGDLISRETPSGEVAHVVHLGPYALLGRAHEAVREWSSQSNGKLAGPNWEIYGHWDPAWASDPSQIRTDVYYALAEL